MLQKSNCTCLIKYVYYNDEMNETMPRVVFDICYSINDIAIRMRKPIKRYNLFPWQLYYLNLAVYL